MAFENLFSPNTQIESFLQSHPGLIYVLIFILIWKLTWYGLAIYKSAQKNQKAWFVILFICAFILNDLGVLAILYVFFNREKTEKTPSKKKK
jgi:RsiW-degrading membrane proteinase PrsW (M82 family)